MFIALASALDRKAEASEIKLMLLYTSVNTTSPNTDQQKRAKTAGPRSQNPLKTPVSRTGLKKLNMFANE